MIKKLHLSSTVALIALVIGASTAHAENKSCSKDQAKLNFVDVCTGYEQGKGLSTNGETNAKVLREQCRCAALSFDVESMANKDCDPKLDELDVFMESARVKLKCR